MNETERRLSRRSFTAVAGAAALLWSSRRGVLPEEPSGKSPPPGRYVDVHVHIGRVWNDTKDLAVKDLLAWMDSRQVAQAVVLPLTSPESSSQLITNEHVLAETRSHRDRLVPFCCLDPRTSWNGGRAGLLDLLRRSVDAGARGFGEHKPGAKIDDPRSRRLYEACGELGLPVLFHLDEQRNMDAPGLPGLETVLRDHPNVQFIGHGPGWWASISGDAKEADLAIYPCGPIPGRGAIDRLMDAYPNIHGDLSAGSGANALQRDPAFAREFVIRRADRLLFGTDFLEPGQKTAQFEILEAMRLPPDVEAKVYRDNARKLLKLGA